MSRLHFDCELVRRSGFRLAARFECEVGAAALSGPSGSGKSTILALIAGLLRPDAGTIRLDDHVLTDTRRGVFLGPESRNIGFVFQDDCLFPHLTVRQNLEYGWKRQRAARRDLQHIVEVLEIGELLERAPLTLSGGQKQRVALGRALLRGPQLLLLDEPLTGLDEPLQERILSYLKRALHDHAVPTLFVTHDSSHVDELAQCIVSIEHGMIVSCGPARIAGSDRDGAQAAELKRATE